MKNIYALIDPRKPEEVRYVGQTVSKLADRLTIHYAASNRLNSPIYVWIRELIAEDIRPAIYLLERAEDGDEAEKRWMAVFSERGAALLNRRAGGGAAAEHVVRVSDIPFDWAAVDRDHSSRGL